MAKDKPTRLTEMGRRADAVWVDPRIIVVRSNVRNFDLKHNIDSIEELANNIAKVGVKTPIIVRYEDGQCILVDGERRLRGALRAIEKGAEIKAIRAIQDLGETSEEKRIAAQILYNNKEDLSQLELGTAFQKLIAFGWSNQQISEHTSYTVQHIQNILKLSDAGEGLKELVATETVSASEATKQLRIRGSKEATKVIKAAAKVAEKAGSTKVTAKHIAEVTGETRAVFRNDDAERAVRSAAEALAAIMKVNEIHRVHRIAHAALQDLGVLGEEVA